MNLDSYLQNIIINKDTKNGKANIRLGNSFIGFQGHFPENPILPGVFEIGFICTLAEKVLGNKYYLTKIYKTKFSAMVKPDELYDIFVEPYLNKEQENNLNIILKGKILNLSQQYLDCRLEYARIS